MAHLVIALTNRCQLRCQHCFAERHVGSGDLSLALLEKVLQEGKSCGITQVSLTGGEPTLHRQFATVLERLCATGYPFGIVSHGATFLRYYALLQRARPWFQGMTFSLDGACEATHDWQRGPGSYRRVLRAASICVLKDLPFILNMVLTTRNRAEVAEMVALARRLGSQGLRFGYLMPTPETARRGLDLGPVARQEVETEIRQLQAQAALPLSMAPGYYSEDPFFPCAPLTVQGYNLNYHGRLTLCCQLSGYEGAEAETEVVGDLYEVSLAEACARFRQRVAQYLADKQARVAQSGLREVEQFPCWYCVQYLGKAQWVSQFPDHSWAVR